MERVCADQNVTFSQNKASAYASAVGQKVAADISFSLLSNTRVTYRMGNRKVAISRRKENITATSRGIVPKRVA